MDISRVQQTHRFPSLVVRYFEKNAYKELWDFYAQMLLLNGCFCCVNAFDVSFLFLYFHCLMSNLSSVFSRLFGAPKLSSKLRSNYGGHRDEISCQRRYGSFEISNITINCSG